MRPGYSFLFFKQKTAYEISSRDWSSDVCSSDLVDPHRESELIEEDVARAHDRLVQVHVAVHASAALAILMRLVRQVVLAGAVHLLVRRDALVLQRREREERLDGRARRVESLQRAVEQRVVLVVAQRDV